MAAYIVANVEVSDRVAYEEYRQQVPAVIAAHGGRFLARGGAAEVLEGETLAHRMVILEFPSMAQAQAFYHSPEYQRLVAIRQRASRASLLAVEGI